MTAWQVPAAGQFGLTGLATSECAALLEQPGSCGPVNGAVDATAAEQRVVGCIDDGIDGKCGDVAFEDLDPFAHTPFSRMPPSVLSKRRECCGADLICLLAKADTAPLERC